MLDIELGEVQAAFADIIWAHKLCEKGLFKNEGGLVTALVSRERFNAIKSERFVEDTFDGSLPAFLAAFMSGRKISAEEAAEIRKMIDEYKEG